MGNVSLKVLEKSLNFCSKKGMNADSTYMGVYERVQIRV